MIDSHSYSIDAAVYQLTGYSVHADQEQLLNWATAIKPKKIKLVHGTLQSKDILGKCLIQKGISIA